MPESISQISVEVCSSLEHVFIMEREITLHLKALEVGQIMDGLEIHSEHWRKTAEFLESGFADDSAFMPFECSDSSEAKWIAEVYDSIITKIRVQFEKQENVPSA